MRAFERFIAIDWSGAKGRYDGIAVAECSFAGGPRLIDPPGRRWNRTAVAEWLESVVDVTSSALIGFDFAFSLPSEKVGRYLPGASSAFDLWRLVDETCCEEPDYYAGSFPADPRFAGDYWAAGAQPSGFTLARRMAEDGCRRAGCGSPDSPFKLIGPKQVGRGGLAGMRVLNRVRQQHSGAVSFWPFEPDAITGAVCVEIYPRLFLRRAGFHNSKIRTADDLAICLSRLNSLPAEIGPGKLTDHHTDALVSAAGLRLLAGDEGLWRVPPEHAARLAQEGWIFGVPHAAAVQ